MGSKTIVSNTRTAGKILGIPFQALIKMCSVQITSYEIIRRSLFGKYLMTETSDRLEKNTFQPRKIHQLNNQGMKLFTL